MSDSSDKSNQIVNRKNKGDKNEAPCATNNEEVRKETSHQRKKHKIVHLREALVDRGIYIHGKSDHSIIDAAIDMVKGAEFSNMLAIWSGSLYGLYTHYGMEQCIVHHPSWILWLLESVVQPLTVPSFKSPVPMPIMPANYNHGNIVSKVTTGEKQWLDYFRLHIESHIPLLEYLQPGMSLDTSIDRLSRAGVPYIIRGCDASTTIAEGVLALIGDTRHKLGLNVLREEIISEIMRVPFNIMQVALDNKVAPSSVKRSMWMGISQRCPYAIAVPCAQPFLRHVYAVKTVNLDIKTVIIALRVDYEDMSPELSVYYKGKQVMHPAVFQLHQLPSIIVVVSDSPQELNDIRNWDLRHPITARQVPISGIKVSEPLNRNSDAILLLGANFIVFDIYYPVIAPATGSWEWKEVPKVYIESLTTECALIRDHNLADFNGSVGMRAPFNFPEDQNRASMGRSMWRNTYTLPTSAQRFTNIMPHVNLDVPFIGLSIDSPNSPVAGPASM